MSGHIYKEIHVGFLAYNLKHLFMIAILTAASCGANDLRQVENPFLPADAGIRNGNGQPDEGGRTPSRPRLFLDTTNVTSKGRQHRIAGGDARAFQAALDKSTGGDVILLEAGATYTGNFVLPKKTGDGWITITTTAPDSKLPPAGTRLTSANAAALPKIVSPNPDAAVATDPGAHHFRFVGVEFSVAPNITKNYGIVRLGAGTRQRSYDAVPYDLIIDRCYIHGHANLDVSRGIELNSARTSIIDSYISEIHGAGFDTQAICGWNGPGPFKIVNNYLEGAGENVMFGGGTPNITNLIPSDIEFRRNHCFKPLSWKRDDPSYAGKHWSVKNLFELKNARRILIEGNLFENNWVDAQNGFAILFTVRGEDGSAPWATIEDVSFANNIVRHTAAGINILGRDDKSPSQQARRLLIRNNLFEDVGGPKWGGNNRFLQVTETIAITVDHNTILQTGNLITAYGKPNVDFVFTNNLAPHNEYGIIGDNTGPGRSTLDRYFPGSICRKNILIGGPGGVYPEENYFPPSFDKISFVNRAGRNYRLSASSQYKNAGTDGKSIGCDLDALDVAIRSSPAPQRSPSTPR
jgi:hypothetical protein